ncbi:MAG: DUF3501 family protein [Gammaproteobacteria bacterium]|nr:DUF3501 family protein [Gammaproteobacteria bacterium]
MNKLSKQDLMSLEDYSNQRAGFRTSVLQYKKTRQLPLGDNARLYFEDRLTIQYQIQEVLRVEKTFDAAGIEEELEAYNPLIPDGSNLKATFMLEFPEVEERQQKTVELRGIEHKVWLQVEDFDKVYPIANEDLSRDDGSRTSMVHFFRYEFSPAMVAALKNGAQFMAGIEHPGYQIDGLVIPAPIRDSLVTDFDAVALN